MRLGGSADSLVWELARKLTDRYNSMQPFFLSFSHPAPHGAFLPLQDSLGSRIFDGDLVTPTPSKIVLLQISHPPSVLL